jgi:hypothetical protein
MSRLRLRTFPFERRQRVRLIAELLFEAFPLRLESLEVTHVVLNLTRELGIRI